MQTRIPLQPLEQGSLSARVYATIRDALIDGGFLPGERILLQDLADRLGTSITPVREACLRLVSERGLEVRSGRFFMVPPLTLGRFTEVRTIRVALEGLAAELAAPHATADDVEHLRDIQERFEAARTNGRTYDTTRLNRDFHFRIYRLSRMAMLVSQIESLWISMGPILKVYHASLGAVDFRDDEHVCLIEALASGDGPAARCALERDLERGSEGIMRFLAQAVAQESAGLEEPVSR
jgi:GntR family transcriptional regulator, colanic acid and biofilm gene transcriptional regulator